MHPQDCTYRRYGDSNQTMWENYAFGLELALHEALLASPHRTLDPDTADFFFVPVYGGCYISRFFRPSPIHNIIMYGEEEWKAAPVRGNEFYREALQWLQREHPLYLECRHLLYQEPCPGLQQQQKSHQKSTSTPLILPLKEQTQMVMATLMMKTVMMLIPLRILEQ